MAASPVPSDVRRDTAVDPVMNPAPGSGFEAPGEAEQRRREAVELAAAMIRVDSTNGNETAVAEILAGYFGSAGIEVELIARDPARANIVARIPGTASGPTLSFVGHSDVVPADARDWDHPPFAAEIDDDGYMWGRGAIDMKNEVASRAAAMASLARTGWRGTGDLLFVCVSDEEDGSADVGMNWLVLERPDIATTYALNEGGGLAYTLVDDRYVIDIAVGEKGTCPILVETIGEAGHASVPTLGDNAVPLLGRLLATLGKGQAEPIDHPAVRSMIDALLGEVGVVDRLGIEQAIALASAKHPKWRHALTSVAGTTMAPTMLHGSSARNVMPARAAVELDCRILPGTTEAEVLEAVRRRLGDDVAYELSVIHGSAIHGNASEPSGPLWDLISSYVAEELSASLMPVLCTGFTDSVYLRREFGTVAYGFSPFASTPSDILEAGYHNKNERVHIDDITLSADFHVHAARTLLG
ncbi:MAG: M20/M25/M40 family metallo-hydrolase [Actinomycetes bacterium]